MVEWLGHCTGNLVVPDLSPSPCLLLGLFSVEFNSLTSVTAPCAQPPGLLPTSWNFKTLCVFTMFNLFVVALKSPIGVWKIMLLLSLSLYHSF